MREPPIKELKKKRKEKSHLMHQCKAISWPQLKQLQRDIQISNLQNLKKTASKRYSQVYDD